MVERSVQLVLSLDACHLKENVPAVARGARVKEPPPRVVWPVMLMAVPACALPEEDASLI